MSATQPFSASVIIVAAGSSSRLQGAVPKQWRMLDGVPLLMHSVGFFQRFPGIGQIVVALDADSLACPDRMAWLQPLLSPRFLVVQGGHHRQATVWSGLRALRPEPDIVLIHDAARPFPPEEGVSECMRIAAEHGGAILAMPIIETVKRVNANHEIMETIARDSLWGAQTPQIFQYRSLRAAFEACAKILDRFTDDAGIFESQRGVVRVVTGSRDNFKVTTAEDFARAEFLAKRNKGEQ